MASCYTFTAFNKLEPLCGDWTITDGTPIVIVVDEDGEKFLLASSACHLLGKSRSTFRGITEHYVTKRDDLVDAIRAEGPRSVQRANGFISRENYLKYIVDQELLEEDAAKLFVHAVFASYAKRTGSSSLSAALAADKEDAESSSSSSSSLVDDGDDSVQRMALDAFLKSDKWSQMKRAAEQEVDGKLEAEYKRGKTEALIEEKVQAYVESAAFEAVIAKQQAALKAEMDTKFQQGKAEAFRRGKRERE